MNSQCVMEPNSESDAFQETISLSWYAPKEALALSRHRMLFTPSPQYILLTKLNEYQTFEALVKTHYKIRVPRVIAPYNLESNLYVFEEDAEHPFSVATSITARHRILTQRRKSAAAHETSYICNL
jgi:hypothetical protein